MAYVNDHFLDATKNPQSQGELSTSAILFIDGLPPREHKDLKKLRKQLLSSNSCVVLLCMPLHQKSPLASPTAFD